MTRFNGENFVFAFSCRTFAAMFYGTFFPYLINLTNLT